ncbi:CPBP family intramembrane glutamic endopeptidase [Massilia sp. YIM B04103]|uniref:CPBP family intramembrane glutamic endopeptidase n=1 Tax=Massilia sp. YIM B04103 TaxID=2963106 RepID=UPI00210B70FC|nr:CPBP family intramembrane glutamic endopeptidase [Massilia sp. YIM B04103]
MNLAEFAPALLQWAFVIAVLVLAAWEQPGARRLKRFSSSAARLAVARRGIVMWWLLALAALALAWPLDLFHLPPPPNGLGWLWDSPWARALAAAVLLLYFGLALAPALQCRVHPRLRLKYASAVNYLHFLLPVSPQERRWWLLLSLTAGVCEELMFRGFLLHFLTGQMAGGLSLNLAGAWLLISLAFGLGHLYQGVAGVLRTTLAGLMFGLLALLSGSLLLPMLLHVLIDAAVLWIYHPQQDHPQAAARLIAGCDPRQAHAPGEMPAT